MTKDEAMDLALEALEYIENNYMSLPKSGSEAITAIKQARSAPVQEPVAFNAGVPPLYPEMKDGETISVEYTTPPAQPAPVQEPVAWSVTWDGTHCGNFFFREEDAIEQRERLSLKFPNEKREVVPLYTTQPVAQRQWVGLTRMELIKCGVLPFGMSYKLYQAVEAKLKEMNT
jgi:hypothetical protein